MLDTPMLEYTSRCLVACFYWSTVTCGLRLRWLVHPS